MDISAFEASASGGGDEPELKDVFLLLDDDLRVPIKAVIVIVKHVGRLFIFVFALGMCVVVYCFAVSWVCMFWLQTHMLFATSSLLRRCLDEPAAPKPQLVDLNQPADAPQAQASHNEAQSPRPEPRAAWVSQQSTSAQAITPVIKPDENATSSFSSGLELPEHMRPTSSGSHDGKVSRRDSGVPKEDSDAGGSEILDRLLQRERELEAEVEAPLPDAQHDAPEQVTSAHEPPAEQFEEPPAPASIDAATGAEPDSRDGAKNPFSFTAEQMAEAASFAAKATRGGEKPKSRGGPPGRLQQRAAVIQQHKILKEQQSQSGWMSNMTSGKGKENVTRPLQATRPFTLTSDKNKPPVPAVGGPKAAQMPLRQTANGTTPKWSEMATMLGQNEGTPASSPMTSAAASPAAKSTGKIPPHIRIREAKAKEEAEKASASAVLQAQAAAVAAAMSQAYPANTVNEQQDEKVATHDARLHEKGPSSSVPVVEQPLENAVAVEDKEQSQTEEHVKKHGMVREQPVNTVPEAVQTDDETNDIKNSSPAVGEHSGYQQWSQQHSQRSEPHSPYVQRLSFYESTPDLKQPAPRSMSADLLRDIDTTSVHTRSAGHNAQCKGCHRWYVTSDDSKLCAPCSAVHDRMQDGQHVVFGELLTKPSAKVDVEQAEDTTELEKALTCEKCGMHDHGTEDCGICLDCDRPDGEPCSKHHGTRDVDAMDTSKHSIAAVTGAPSPKKIASASEPEIVNAGPSEKNITPTPVSRREGTPADLIEFKSSGEPRSSLSSAPEAKVQPSPWQPRAPPFFAPTSSASNWQGQPGPVAQRNVSLPQMRPSSHAATAVDPFAPGPFQTDWWTKHIFGDVHAQALQYETQHLSTPAPKPVAPPGLGGPQASRQASFDALLTPADLSMQKQRSGYDQAIGKAQLEIRPVGVLKQSETLGGLKDFSKTFNLPEAFARKVVDTSVSIVPEVDETTERSTQVSAAEGTTVAADSVAQAPEVVTKEEHATPEQLDSAVAVTAQDSEPVQIDPEAEKAREAKKLVKKLRLAKETQEKQVDGAVLIPDELAKVNKISEHIQQLAELGYDENGEKKIAVADAGDSSGSDDTKTAKPALRDQKKAAREALKAAWVERDMARARVIGDWSMERVNDLKASNSKYNEHRAELASLMADGKLLSDDAKVFPEFNDLDLSEPKHKPQGTGQLRRLIREKQASALSSENDAATASPPPAPNAEVQNAKAKLVSARTLREQALDYFKQPQPQSNVRYDTWKAVGDGKMARANAYYKKKRNDLVALFPNTGLPADLEEDFPEIS